MAKGLMARKIGMTSLFEKDGCVLPVTILQVEKNLVTQVKNKKNDGYDAVQIGFSLGKESSLNKFERSRQKGTQGFFRFFREFRDFGECELGQEIGLDIFEVGKGVKVGGVSKGKGFQGVMKRHGFSGGRATHGSHFHRSTGSLNASAYPSRVFKGKKMPGRTGGNYSTIRSLKLVAIDKEKKLLFIKGAVPGPCQSCVKVEVLKK